jgi:hypothetical protein
MVREDKLTMFFHLFVAEVMLQSCRSFPLSLSLSITIKWKTGTTYPRKTDSINVKSEDSTLMPSVFVGVDVDVVFLFDGNDDDRPRKYFQVLDLCAVVSFSES